MPRYVISHTGKPGGPWESCMGGSGYSTPKLRDAEVVPSEAYLDALLEEVRKVHPNAKVLRLVPKGTADTKRRALRDAVVEAADAWVGPPHVARRTEQDERLYEAVRALRAHERGE